MRDYDCIKYYKFIVISLVMLNSSLIAQNIKDDNFMYKGNQKVNIKNHITTAMYNIHSPIYTGTPEENARHFLNENKSKFGISDVSDLMFLKTIESPAGKHVGALQTYQGIPVFGSETVISFNKENRVTMVVNGNRPIIGVKNITANISKDVAITRAIEKVNTQKENLIAEPNIEQYIYTDSLDNNILTWKINFTASHPHGSWQVFVDANTGQVLNVKDIGMYYVNGSGKVFKPDPITDLENTSLTDQNDSDYTGLQSAYKTVTLNNLNNAVGGIYRLQGKYAKSVDIEERYITPVTSTTTSFMYNRSQPGFEEVNTYYFINLIRQYVGALGFNSIQWNGYDYIRFDAHGTYCDCSDTVNAWYDPSQKYLAFGDGCIDAAEDQDVIIHEYTHALHDVLLTGGLSNRNNNTSAISEGSSDYISLSYRRTLSNFQQNHSFNWFGNGECFNGRNLNPSATYPHYWYFEVDGLKDRNVYAPHFAGILWSSTLMDIEMSNGMGRDITNTL